MLKRIAVLSAAVLIGAAALALNERLDHGQDLPRVERAGAGRASADARQRRGCRAANRPALRRGSLLLLTDGLASGPSSRAAQFRARFSARNSRQR